MCTSILRESCSDNHESILRNNQKMSVELPLQTGSELFRTLTPGEIKLAKTIFQNIINYDRIKIYCGNNQSRTQSKVITNTQNGKVQLSIKEYRSDFSADYTSYHESVKYPHIFIFAMSFVWQYFRHDTSFHDNTYASSFWQSYDFHEPRFSFYSMEQQAAIISDYWLLNNFDITEYEELSSNQEYERFKINVSMKMDLLDKYESMLRMHIQYMG